MKISELELAALLAPSLLSSHASPPPSPSDESSSGDETLRFSEENSASSLAASVKETNIGKLSAERLEIPSQSNHSEVQEMGLQTTPESKTHPLQHQPLTREIFPSSNENSAENTHPTLTVKSSVCPNASNPIIDSSQAQMSAHLPIPRSNQIVSKDEEKREEAILQHQKEIIVEKFKSKVQGGSASSVSGSQATFADRILFKRKEYLNDKWDRCKLRDAEKLESRRRESQRFAFKNWINFHIGKSSGMGKIDDLGLDLSGEYLP